MRLFPCALCPVLAVSVYLFSTSAAAQKPGKPMKAEQLIAAAANDNGVDHSDVRPWHLKAEFKIVDEKGATTNAGTLEQWWWSPRSYKTTWNSTALNQTDIATDAGLFRSGDGRWETRQEFLVEALLHDPVGLYHYDPKLFDMTDQVAGTGTSRLRCLFLSHKREADARLSLQSTVDVARLPGLCFEPDTTALRVMTSGNGGDTTVLAALGSFGGRFVPKSIQIARGGRVSLTVQVAQLEALKDMAPPQAPAGVAPLHGPVDLPEGRLRLLSHADIPPTLQTYSSQQLTPVAFVVKFRVGANGHVLDASVQGTPSSDITASMVKVIKQQTFEPFRILDTPVEVNTEYTFHLGGEEGQRGGGRSR